MDTLFNTILDNIGKLENSIDLEGVKMSQITNIGVNGVGGMGMIYSNNLHYI